MITIQNRVFPSETPEGESVARDESETNRPVGCGESVRQTAEQMINRHPAMTVGAAIVTGVLVGWLIKRR